MMENGRKHEIDTVFFYRRFQLDSSVAECIWSAGDLLKKLQPEGFQEDILLRSFNQRRWCSVKTAL